VGIEPGSAGTSCALWLAAAASTHGASSRPYVYILYYVVFSVASCNYSIWTFRRSNAGCNGTLELVSILSCCVRCQCNFKTPCKQRKMHHWRGRDEGDG
jgi:hypothetical protein